MYSTTIGGFMEEMSRAYSLQMAGGTVQVYGGSAEHTEPSRANAEDIRQLFLGGKFSVDIDGMLAEAHGGECLVEGCYDGEDGGAYDFDESLVTPDVDHAAASDVNEEPIFADTGNEDYDFELD
jgi:hypothetical protein